MRRVLVLFWALQALSQEVGVLDVDCPERLARPRVRPENLWASVGKM